MAADLHVPLTSPVVGYAAFATAGAGNFSEMDRVVALLRLTPRPPAAGTPHWLRKLAGQLSTTLRPPPPRRSSGVAGGGVGRATAATAAVAAPLA